MAERRFSNLVGFDDAPFARGHHGPVKVVGAVFAHLRFDGVLVGSIEKDGADSASRLAELVVRSRFHEHIQLVLLQGVAFGGFNVVDVFQLHRDLDRPVMVVARKAPDMVAIREALVSRIPEGETKWSILERLGPMEPVHGVFVQRVGLSMTEAASVIERFAVHGRIPEPLRVAHLIAGAIAEGHSRGRA